MIEVSDLMIQRLVDGELSPDLRSKVLAALEKSGEWRSVALRFVENQMLAQAIQHLDESDDADARRVADRGRLRRFIRPLSSMAAALCVGALTGLAGHFWLQQRPALVAPQTQQARMADGQADVVSTANVNASRPHAAVAASPVMNVNLVGLKAGSSEPVSVPVFSPEQWYSMPQLQNSSMLPADTKRQLENLGFVVDGERQWYRAALDDGREILVPTETVKLRYAVQ